MPKYFNITKKKQPIYGVLGLNYPQVRGAIIDLYNNGYWKIGPVGGGSSTHMVMVDEYEVDGSGLTRAMAAIAKRGSLIGNKDYEDFYSNLYKGDSTGCWYSFPRIISPGTDIHPPLSNNWADQQETKETIAMFKGVNKFSQTQGGRVGKIGRVAGGISGVADKLSQAAEDAIKFTTRFAGANYAKDPIKTFSDTAPYSITINFQLYNSERNGDSKHVDLHKEFINLFYFQNLKTRTGPFTMLPPKIYDIKSYPKNAAMYLPNAVVTAYQVKSIGKTHQIDDSLIPEGYDVFITFTSLTAATSNAFQYVMT